MVIKTEYLKSIKGIKNNHRCNNCVIGIYGEINCNNKLVKTYIKDIGYFNKEKVG